MDSVGTSSTVSTAEDAGSDTDPGSADEVAGSVRRILEGIVPDRAEMLGNGRDLRDLGLDSLAVTRLVLELLAEFEVEVSMADLGRCHAVDDIAALVIGRQQAGGGGGGRPAAVRPDPAARHEPFALTAVQQAYLAGRLPELTADPVGCHIYREFDIEDVDADRLRAAWQRVVEHNSILRSVVTADGRQQVAPDAPAWDLLVHDLAGDKDFLDVRGDLSHRHYPAGLRPPFAIAVSRRPGRSDVVHLSIDAMVTDGRGLDLLLEQWWQVYENPDAVLKPAELEARDCVLALQEQLNSPAWEADLAYWRDRLADLPQGPAVLADPQPSRTVPAGARGARRRPLSAGLDAQQWAAVRERAAGIGVTPTAFVVGVFADVFARHRPGGPFSLVLTTNQRGRLPAAAQEVVGPFTSTCVFVVDDLNGLGLDEVARTVGRRLWEDLDHSLVSGIEALRTLRVRDAVLPVVFTSLLDDSRPSPSDGFAQSVSYALSQTSDVAIDAQMWEANGELRLRWDVSEATAVGVAEVGFAAFVNTLMIACAPKAEHGVFRPLNELQQAYYVAAASGSGPWDGCQVYHAFDVEDLDLARLQDAWAGMIAQYEVLRTEVTADGRLFVRESAPAGWLVPVVDLDADSGLEYGHDLVSRAFPLGRWPRFDLRVTRSAAGSARVHLTVDLIVCDGRSVHFLMRELFRRYAEPEARAEHTEPYESYEAWQQEQLSSEQLPEWKAHWRERAQALPPGPRLPMAQARGGERSRVRHVASVSGWPGLRERVRQQGLSPDAVIVSALTRALAEVFDEPFAVPLVRWSEQFAAWRPGEYTALSWVEHLRDTGVWEQAAANQAVIDADAQCDAVSGLAEIRRAALRRRKTGHAGYPVVITGLLELAGQPLPEGVTSGPWATCTPDVSMDCIAMECGDDELRVFWDVVEADFAPGVVERVFASYLRSLRALADGQDDVDAAGLDPSERRRILFDFNATDRPHRAEGPIHLAFEEQARLRPGAIALRWRDGSLTYRELNRRANAIAAELRGLGVGAGSVAGICVGRGPEMVAGVYGVLKAGGAYLPIEPSLPGERAAGMLAESGASVVLTAGGVLPVAPPAGVAMLDLGSVSDSAATDQNPEPVNGVDDAAYIIYTSGSTGRPKGVVVTHRPLHNLFAWCHRMYGFDSSDVGLSVTSLGFDLSAFDLLGLLGRGAGVYIADEVQQKDPALLLEVLLTEPITFWNSAPTTLAQLAPLFPEPGTAAASKLRLVFLSGDYTPLPLPARLTAAFPSAQLVSLGGATEATIWSNYFPVATVDPDWRSIPYGRPIDNCRYYVLDERLEPCAPGVEGDLFIAGACLSSGYVGRPDLTAERFVLDPHAAEPSELMYRTGDRAAYFPDGVLEFRGRQDGQVKIRGFRVELGEIEHRLRSHAGVADVVVVARPDDAGDRRVVAYVVPEGGAAPSVPELRQYAAQALPDYMVPNVVGFVDRFPATSNGKLDRDALPWPVPTAGAVAPEPAAPAAPAAPTGAAAQVVGEVAALFAELLGVERIETDADLWDQGATSFTMVRVSGMLQERFGRRIAVSTLLSEPTVEGIAQAVAGSEPPTEPEDPSPSDTQLHDIEPASTTIHVDFFDPASRAAFHDGHANLRSVQAPLVELPDVRITKDWYLWRSSRRDFLAEPLPLTELGHLLSLLRPWTDGERDRYLYPSAGDTYAVQVYVRTFADRVAGLPAGVYYYQPSEHGLRLVNATPSANRRTHFFYNREIHDRAAFELHLVGQTRGIEPLYGTDSTRYLAIEAGHIAQLLMTGQAAAGPGLCPIGALAEEPTRADLALDPEHQLLLSFLGGPVTRPTTSPNGPRPPYEATATASAEAPTTHHSAAAAALTPTAAVPAPTTLAAPTPAALTPTPTLAAPSAFGIAAAPATPGIAPAAAAHARSTIAAPGIAAAPAAAAPASAALTTPAVATLATAAPPAAAAPADVAAAHTAASLTAPAVFAAPAEPTALASPAAPAAAARTSTASAVVAPAAPAAPPAPSVPAAAPRTSAASAASAAVAPAVFDIPAATTPRTAIAIVGMAARLPGADDLDTLWRNLSAGRSAVAPLDARRAAALGLPQVRGGFLSDIESFDALRFRIAPSEAAGLDPQARQVLEAVWRCVEDAGRTDALADLGRVGVFVGSMWPDFQLAGADAWRVDGTAAQSGIASDLPNRVSHAFGFTGPSVAVDTSCSSSLTALHLAVQSIRLGECAAAVVAGVNLIAHPYHLALLSGLDLLGRKEAEGAFDGEAPGWTPAEGVAAVLLRPADAAAEDRDLVHAVIEGSWTGHLGTAPRFGAPDAGALTGSLRHALAAAGLTAADIDYVECAAAGAALADAAEIEALGRVFADRARPVAFGTVKPNLGHLESASGMSQLAKVVLQLRHGRLAPTLLASHRSPLISWDPKALRVVDAIEPWPPHTDPAAPPRALINALGATGSLAHIIIRGAK
ncbi:amino acid adenylation domain protein [Catenulispora acidiphila DSM 44928]|uniref:Amino acid adenylation domain protein n=1 Tax=Catenulispora acidiphila (strain DSM 44928 / JCM 14897 / NBRC 102108 / NRRL B-24433 / ID139908) TaxID=479433 RepID=C7PXQ7_CATAD|nr:non-ribosomal peptide synthetase [Catenulispora acidiphila]ACU71510.1 amino acid adenylation domain protein [Catenulispora acidiphila DSM 44928]